MPLLSQLRNKTREPPDATEGPTLYRPPRSHHSGTQRLCPEPDGRALLQPWAPLHTRSPSLEAREPRRNCSSCRRRLCGALGCRGRSQHLSVGSDHRKMEFSVPGTAGVTGLRRASFSPVFPGLQSPSGHLLCPSRKLMAREVVTPVSVSHAGSKWLVPILLSCPRSST